VDEDTEQKKTSEVVNMSSNIGIPAVHQVKECVSLCLQIIALYATGLRLYEGFELS